MKLISRTQILDDGGGNCEGCSVNVESIRMRIAEEFKPFALVTSSGNKYRVPHQDFIFLTPRTVIVVDDRGYAIHLDPLHIVGLQDIPERANGRRKRSRK